MLLLKVLDAFFSKTFFFNITLSIHLHGHATLNLALGVAFIYKSLHLTFKLYHIYIFKISIHELWFAVVERFDEVTVLAQWLVWTLHDALLKGLVFILYNVLYENIDQILPNKLHGPMHYKIGVTCVYNGHMFYTLL